MIIMYFFFAECVFLQCAHPYLSFLVSLTGFIYPGFCVGFSAGKVHAQGLLWPVESCRDGGMHVCTCVKWVLHRCAVSPAFLIVSLHPTAPDRAFVVCSDGDLLSLYSLQGRLLSTFCGPFHFAALP